MIIIACIDCAGGMLFNHRRVSRDSVVTCDILRECAGKKLYVSQYSSRMFEKEKAEMMVSEDMMRAAKAGDVCFIEDTGISGFEEQIEKIILYQWNRSYPADVYFPLGLLENNWELIKQEEWKGTSHERITKSTYVRRESL